MRHRALIGRANHLCKFPNSARSINRFAWPFPLGLTLCKLCFAQINGEFPLDGINRDNVPCRQKGNRSAMRSLWPNVPHTKPTRCARKAAIGDQRDFLAHALSAQGSCGCQHLAHTRPASRPLVANDKHLALLIGALLNRFKGLLLTFKNPSWTCENLMLRRNPCNFHNRTFGRDIALKAHNPTGFGDWRLDRIDHAAIGLAFDPVQRLAQRHTRRGHAVFVQQACLAQFLHHNRHATRFIKVFRHIVTTWFQVDEIGCVPENVTNIFKVKFDTCLMRNCRQV